MSVTKYHLQRNDKQIAIVIKCETLVGNVNRYISRGNCRNHHDFLLSLAVSTSPGRIITACQIAFEDILQLKCWFGSDQNEVTVYRPFVLAVWEASAFLRSF